MLETIVIMPIMIFAVLGVVQLMLVQHGRISAEYAAYCAARAGIVHSGNWNVMRNAALLASLPVYGRTDDPERLLRLWAKVKSAAEMTEAVDTGAATLERLAGELLGVEVGGLAQDISLIEVAVSEPSPETFDQAGAWTQRATQRAGRIDATALEYPDGEIDFDDAAMMSDPSMAATIGTLALEVRVLYPLKIPLVNSILFELWLAHELLGSRRYESDLNDWTQFRTRMADGSGSGQTLSEAVEQADGDGPLDDFLTTSQWVKELRTLRTIAERHHVYLVPIRAEYALPMQSNLFEKNQREPVWFSLGGGR